MANEKENAFKKHGAEKLDRLAALICAEGVSAMTLYAWVEARELPELVEEMVADDAELKDGGWMTGDQLESNWESEADDARDFVDQFCAGIDAAHAYLCEIEPARFGARSG